MSGANVFSTLLEKAKRYYRQRQSLDVLNAIDQPFRDALISLYRGEPQRGDGDQVFAMEFLGTKISPEQGIWIYNLCREIKPEATLEIGLAYGFSMLFFLAASKKNGKGSHTAIDPFPWNGVAYCKAREVAMPLEAINELSERAGVDLARNERKFDVIFIDGNHRFDNALMDFSLFSRVCSLHGYVILDDMWMSSIQAVVRFLKKNRTDFELVPTPVPNIAVFKKIAEDTRRWDHFKRF